MDMCFQDMRDPHVLLAGHFDIRIHVPLGIDDRCDTCFLTADEITGLRQRLVVNVLKIHACKNELFQEQFVYDDIDPHDEHKPPEPFFQLNGTHFFPQRVP